MSDMFLLQDTKRDFLPKPLSADFLIAAWMPQVEILSLQEQHALARASATQWYRASFGVLDCTYVEPIHCESWGLLLQELPWPTTPFDCSALKRN